VTTTHERPASRKPEGGRDSTSEAIAGRTGECGHTERARVVQVISAVVSARHPVAGFSNRVLAH
jgi:hypothetical protein